MMTAAAVLVLQALGLGGSAPPALWVTGGILTLALVPLLQTSGLSAAGVLRLAASAWALAAVYFGLHAWLATWASPAAQAPASVGAIAVASAFALLFGLQSTLSIWPQGALARRLYPALYGGLFLDERFSRLVFRLWPLASAEPKRAEHTAPLPTPRF
jgi:NAD(P)H-quinone oxidoreductase subunit 5